jgi:hypothetical protein
MIRPPKSDLLRKPWYVFLIGFAIRAGSLLYHHYYRIPVAMDHLMFAAEEGHIARALVTGYGYADPFYLTHTGPTAWLPPGYPLVIAGVFRLFGLYSNASALVILLLQCLAQAAVALWVWELGVRTFSPRVAIVAAWLWAIWPDSMQYAFLWIWETAFSTFFFAAALVLTVRLGGLGPRPGNPKVLWPLFGLAWGLVSLFNPTLLIVLPVAGLWILLSRTSSQSMRNRTYGALVSAIFFLALFMPWTIRNYRIFHAFIPSRSNFGTELCLGNCYGVNGVYGDVNHPNMDAEETVRFHRIGELEYNRQQMSEALAHIRSSPSTFLKLTLLRFYFFWFGLPGLPTITGFIHRAAYTFISCAGFLGIVLAVRGHLAAAGLYLSAMILVSLPSYLVVVLSTRHRHPIEPILYLGAAFLVLNAQPNFRIRLLLR